MPMSPFYLRCLQTALRETRNIILPKSSYGIPAGKYVFHELYCDEPDCDCRRVILQVYEAADAEMSRALASVNFGWEKVDFYRKWMKGNDDEMAKEMAGVTLELFAAQGPNAQAFCALVQSVLEKDTDLVLRFKRHYLEFKKSLS